jgi:hypothetical protein
MSSTRSMKIGTWITVAGIGLWLIGGALLLLVSLIWWTPASGTIAGVVSWGMGSGTAILAGAGFTVAALKAENAGLKAENDRLRAGSAEPSAGADRRGM